MSPLADPRPSLLRPRREEVPRPGLLLTKRRPIDFGRVATCLCCLVD